MGNETFYWDGLIKLSREVREQRKAGCVYESGHLKTSANLTSMDCVVVVCKPFVERHSREFIGTISERTYIKKSNHKTSSSFDTGNQPFSKCCIPIGKY